MYTFEARSHGHGIEHDEIGTITAEVPPSLTSANAFSAEREAALLAAKTIRGLRATRAEFLPGNLFADPAWDILLTLFVAHSEQYRLKVTNLIVESRVPNTTCLRWIDTLVEAGLVKKFANPVDARSSYVELTPKAAEKMSALLFASRI